MDNLTNITYFTFDFSDILNNENDQINQLFDSNQTDLIKPVKKKFLQELNENKYTVKNTDKLSCCLCMEEFEENEKVYKLPCDDNSHYFHINSKSNNSECSGIEKWFLENNTCPMCRTEFPCDEVKKPEIIQYPIDDIINYYNETNNVNHFINNLGRSYFHNGLPYQILNQTVNQIPSPNTILNHNFITNVVDRIFEDEEERQIQEAIELSLRD